MSHQKPVAVIGAAVLDGTFAQALLANPCQALADAHLSLAPEDIAPFQQGAVSLGQLAQLVLDWELAAGRAEAPLRVPALERVRHRGEPEVKRPQVVDEKALAA